MGEERQESLTRSMGEVLLVQDLEMRREVAMKVMKKNLALHDAHRLKFVAEAQATSQLEHPGIPPVHDLGLTAEAAPYLTMKLVRGTTLRDVLQNLLLRRKEFRKEYTLHRLISILERICEALHFAHEKGVLHRDLKPENVMLGDFGEVHVMDRGIARVRGEEEGTWSPGSSRSFCGERRESAAAVRKRRYPRSQEMRWRG